MNPWVKSARAIVAAISGPGSADHCDANDEIATERVCTYTGPAGRVLLTLRLPARLVHPQRRIGDQVQPLQRVLRDGFDHVGLVEETPPHVSAAALDHRSVGEDLAQGTATVGLDHGVAAQPIKIAVVEELERPAPLQLVAVCVHRCS